MRWRLNHDYVRDRAWMKADPILDGHLRLDPAPVALPEKVLEAAE